jgi:hypothetical protein
VLGIGSEPSSESELTSLSTRIRRMTCTTNSWQFLERAL